MHRLNIAARIMSHIIIRAYAFYLEDYENAIEKFEESLAQNDSYHEARKWLEKAKDKIKEKKGEASHGVLVVEDSDEGNTSNFVGNNDANAANNRVLKFSNKQKLGQVMVV